MRLELASGFHSITFEDIFALLLVVKMYSACRFATDHLKVFFLKAGLQMRTWAGLLLRDFLSQMEYLGNRLVSLLIQIFEVES